MNRKNTIIIAVLVNAGLLLILFATAMRSGDKKEESPVKLAEAPLVPKEPTSHPVTTEELLNEYIAAAVPQEQDDVIVLEDIVNGSTVLETSIIQSPQQQVVSSMPAIAPSVAVATPTQGSSSLATAPNAPKNAAPKAVKPTPVANPTKETLAEVTVKKGDYLEKIAKANQTTVAAIMESNSLSSSNLKVGQVLKMPGKAKSNPSPTHVTGDASSLKDFYIVKEGDSPWLIASKCNVKLDELLRMNNIDEQKAKKLRPGDKLRIR